MADNSLIRQMNKKVLRLAIPSILANITVPLVGMVDVGVVGHIGDAVAIGGMAISTMLFDLLYWNMGFLRVGTGGMIAQALGRRDLKDVMKIFTQGIGTALSIALIIFAIQYLYIDIALGFINCSPQVAEYARQYYFIRIWAAPATLSLFVFKGFFIGMQNAISPMAADITVNVANLGLCLLFAVKFGMGFKGIAWAVFTAQYTGLALCIILFLIYYRKLFKYSNVKESLRLKDLGKFFSVNGNLFVRSICFLFIYVGFTSLSANYGDTQLAVGTIIMKLLMLFSFFIDGFAYAGEALAGKYIGAKDGPLLRHSVRVIFRWCFWIAVASTVVYVLGGKWMFTLMTDKADVIEASLPFLVWLWVMPALSTSAFVWDGIYVGATSTRSIMWGMIFAALAFFGFYYALRPLWGIQALYAAYMAHVVVRSIWMYAFRNKAVFSKVPL
ncbi:MAG: MATE family efflux transporter [Bacteroidales bacterium]|nr:MATE family efflux transporter [Bacteroidales bacterium]